MKTFNLKTQIGNVIFSLREKHPKEHWFNFDVKCIMEQKFSRFYPEGFFCSLHYNDLNRLVHDFESHCQDLKNDTFKKEINYMPLEADFQLTLYDGGYENGQGTFTICFMINIGALKDDGSCSYFGFQTSVDFHDVNKLCNDINSLLGLYKKP